MYIIFIIFNIVFMFLLIRILWRIPKNILALGITKQKWYPFSLIDTKIADIKVFLLSVQYCVCVFIDHNGIFMVF